MAFIARPDSSLDWLGPFHDEERGCAAFFGGLMRR
jgi:hypothetical protein